MCVDMGIPVFSRVDAINDSLKKEKKKHLVMGGICGRRRFFFLKESLIASSLSRLWRWTAAPG